MTRRTTIILTVAVALAAFVAAALVFQRGERESQVQAAAAAAPYLVRSHSPVIGPPEAPVTIVEFFDPACETCRAFYPVVKEIIAAFPGEVRLVIRYTPLHPGSDEAAAILEAARRQGRFEPVLEALLDAQPAWAQHGAPDLAKAWHAAGAAGLDLTRARQDAASLDVQINLRQDLADIAAAGVRQTPTFFVNGKPLPAFGAQQLHDLVRAEVEAARGRP